MGGATAEGGVREVGGRDRGCGGEGREVRCQGPTTVGVLLKACLGAAAAKACGVKPEVLLNTSPCLHACYAWWVRMCDYVTI